MAIYVSGGEFREEVVLKNDAMYVYKDGVASGTFLDNGYIYVTGGSASDIAGNGYLYVYSSGSVTSAYITHGDIYVSGGGMLASATLQSGAIVIRGENTTASNIVQNGGTLNISSGAAVNGVQAGSGVNLYISNGANVDNVIVSSGAFANIYSGAVIDGIKVASGGTLTIASGATATDIDWNPLTGNLVVENGANVTPGSFKSSYSGVYFSGASKTTLQPSLTELSEGKMIVIDDREKMYVMKGGKATAIEVKVGDMHVWSGGKASCVFLRGLDPRMFISSGGAADIVAIQQGTMNVYGGGTATKIIAGSTDTLVNVYSGATVNDITVYGGAIMNLQAKVTQSQNYYSATISGQSLAGKFAGMAPDIVRNDSIIAGVSGGGMVNVYNGGIINNFVIGGNWNSSYVNTVVENLNDPATRTSLSYNHYDDGYMGIAKIVDNGTANNTTLYGVMVVSGGGVVNNTNVIAESSGGYLSSGSFWSKYESKNAQGETVTMSKLVFSSAYESQFLSSGGTLVVMQGGSANNTTVGGVMHVSGGVASGVTVAGSASSVDDPDDTEERIYSSGLFVTEGTLKIDNGGIAYDVTNYGNIEVSGNGIIHDLVVSSGTVNVADGTLHNITNHAGYVTINGGTLCGGTILGKVNVGANGGTLDFTVSEFTTLEHGNYILRDINKISGYTRLDFTITVDANQVDGTYGLAQKLTDASILNKTFTIQGVNDTTATISLKNIDGVVYNNKYYNLAISAAGDLTLVISSDDPGLVAPADPTFTTSAPLDVWTKEITVTANYAIGTVKKMYSTDGLTWESYTGAITLRHSGTLYFKAINRAGIESNIVECVVNCVDSDAPEFELVRVDAENYSTKVEVTVTNLTDYQKDANGNPIYMYDQYGNPVYETDYNGKVIYIEDANGNLVPKPKAVQGEVVKTEYQFRPAEGIWQDVWTTGTKAIVEQNGTVVFRVWDAAGNYSEQEYIVSTIGDTTLPELNVTGNVDNWTNEDITISVVATDLDGANGFAKLQYSTDGGKTWVNKFVENGSTTVELNHVVSENTEIIFRAVDEAGNKTEQVVNVNRIDKTAPVVTITGIPETWENNDVTLGITAVDGENASGVEKIEYRFGDNNWDDTANTTVVFGTSTSVEATKNDILYIRVTDKVGNVSEDQVINIGLIDQTEPEVNLAPFSVPKNGAYTVELECSDAISGVASVQWAFATEDSETAPAEGWNNGTTVEIPSNGYLWLSVIDNAGNKYEEKVVINNIENVAPTVKFSFDSTKTQESVELSIIGTDNSGISSIAYRTSEDGEWITIEDIAFDETSATGVINISDNGKVYVKVVDKAGNVGYDEVNLDVIDREAPEFKVNGDFTTWTNKELVLTVSGDEVTTIYYCFDGNWDNAITSNDLTITVSQNTDVYVKAADEAGNISAQKFVRVNNIDTVLPEFSWFFGAAYSRVGIVVSAEGKDYQSGVEKMLYRFGNDNWADTANTKAINSANGNISVTQNGTVFVKVIDFAGNEFVQSFEVDRIDRLAPSVEITGNATKWTTDDVVLTLTTTDKSDDANVSSGIAKVEYSVNGGKFTGVADGKITLAKNAEVVVKVTDFAGNVTEKTVSVNKIDKDAPIISITGNATELTNQNVVLTANVSDNGSGVSKTEYSFDNVNWKKGTTVTAKENGTVYFRVTDAVGNVKIDSVVVDKIDKIGPEISVAGMPAEETRKAITLTASAKDQAGIAKVEYSIDNKKWTVGDTVTVSNNTTVYFRATDKLGNVSTTPVKVDKIIENPANTNILSNGTSQIVGWDEKRGAVGYVAVDGEAGPQWNGIYEWHRGDALKWKVCGVGHFAGTNVDYDGVLLYNAFGNTFAAWTDLSDPSYGYVSLCHVGSNFNTNSLANLDNDKYDDILISDEKGSFGVVLDGTTYKDIWHVEEGKTTPWKLEGAGTFAKGAEQLIVKNTSNGHLYLWQNKDTSFKTWNWSQTDIGYVGDDWEFVAAGDFSGDGIDDIVVRKVADGGLWMWDNGKSNTAHWVVTPEDGFAVEAVGDYNADGKDDILVREYNTGWGGLGYYAFGTDSLWNDLNARIETDLESQFTIIA